MKQVRQTCRRCNGTGVNTKKVLKNKDGEVLLSPPYHSPDDKRRPQYENCTECKGSGLAMYDAPAEVLKDGKVIPLGEEEREARFSPVHA